MLHDVGAVDEFPHGQVTLRHLDRFDVAVLRWRDGFFAVRNVCPHLGGPLCAGEAMPSLGGTAAIGEDLTVDEGHVLLACPWHRWQFDLRTGHSPVGRLRARVYEVTVEDGRVYVEISRRTAAVAVGRPSTAHQEM